MKKKIMSLALALVMCMTLCVPAFARNVSAENSNSSYAEQVKFIEDLYSSNPNLGSFDNIDCSEHEYTESVSEQIAVQTAEPQFNLDDQASSIIDAMGTGKVISDMLFDDERCIDIQFIDGTSCTVTCSPENTDIALRTDTDQMIEYVNGIKILDEPVDRYTETASINEDVENFIETHSITDIIDHYDATVSESGEIILPDSCYEYAGSKVNNLQTRSSSTLVMPAGNMEDAYPQYTQKEVYNTSRYVSALAKSVPFKVTTSRNNYYKSRSTLIKVAAGISLAIAAQEVLVASGLLKTLLAAYGLYSAARGVVSAFSFPDRYEYSVHFSKVGWVYDTATFNNYVRYVGSTATATGKISLAWDADSNNYRSNFEWKVTSLPHNVSVANSVMVTDVYQTYCADIASDNRCDTEIYCVWNYGGEKV